jgi:hypothetical protein
MSSRVRARAESTGRFLPLGQAYADAELSGMRYLWASKSSFAALLRSPVHGSLPSLLRGDDYFLPELRRAFEGVVHTPGINMTDPRERPVDLFPPTTIPEGQRRRFSGVLEQPIWEVEHTSRFTLSRNPSALRRPGTADQQDVGEPSSRR